MERCAVSGGRIRREKAGTREIPGTPYRKRKTEALQEKKLPEFLRKRVVIVSDLAALARQHSESKGKHCPHYQHVIRQQLAGKRNGGEVEPPEGPFPRF